MENQCKVNSLTWKEFLLFVKNSSGFMNFGEADLKYFEHSEGTELIILEASVSYTIKNYVRVAADAILKEINDLGIPLSSARMFLFLLQYPSVSPITMEDMNSIAEFSKKLSENVEMKWDLSPIEGSTCRLIYAIKV